MRWDVHSLVKDAHDVDSLVRGEKENEMLARRIDPKVLVDFIVDSPESGFFCERFERMVQNPQIE